MSSLASLSLTALALAASVSASGHCYQVSDEYTPSNFFSKFNFFESNYDTNHYNEVDPNSGHVNYRNRKDAADLGLIKTDGSAAFLGVNHGKPLAFNRGLDSVKIVSKQTYDKGLIIADFTHLPKPACGQWPAFWMYGDDWPLTGELDIFEPHNEETNKVVMHTGKAGLVGSCMLVPGEMTGTISSHNCDNDFQDPPRQYQNQGGAVKENVPSYWQGAGTVYATEWSSHNISVWSWARDAVPSDVLGKTPNPRRWGPPSFYLSKATCNIDKVLMNQRLVLNINFCGDLAGNTEIWKHGGCAAKTGFATCNDYVRSNPGAFKDAFFKVAGIKYYEYKAIVEEAGNSTSGGSNNGGDGNGNPSNDGTSGGGNHNGGHGAPFSNGTVTTSHGGATSTIYSTSYYTVTSCAPTVKNCHAGQVTSEVVVVPTPDAGSGSGDSTIVNGKDGYSGTVGAGGCVKGGCGKPIETGSGSGFGSGSGSDSGSGSGTKPSSTAADIPKSTGGPVVGGPGSNSTKIVVSGAGMVGVSAVLGIFVAGMGMVLAL